MLEQRRKWSKWFFAAGLLLVLLAFAYDREPAIGGMFGPLVVGILLIIAGATGR